MIQSSSARFAFSRSQFPRITPQQGPGPTPLTSRPIQPWHRGIGAFSAGVLVAGSPDARQCRLSAPDADHAEWGPAPGAQATGLCWVARWAAAGGGQLLRGAGVGPDVLRWRVSQLCGCARAQHAV
eukprot:scaffold526_cov230-Pinguiococcus_pyrenoidosus.AAC.5